MLLTADMGIGYNDHSLYHWPTPRALATATHLIAEGTSGSRDGQGELGALWLRGVLIGRCELANLARARPQERQQ